MSPVRHSMHSQDTRGTNNRAQIVSPDSTDEEENASILTIEGWDGHTVPAVASGNTSATLETVGGSVTLLAKQDLTRVLIVLLKLCGDATIKVETSCALMFVHDCLFSNFNF